MCNDDTNKKSRNGKNSLIGLSHVKFPVIITLCQTMMT